MHESLFRGVAATIALFGASLSVGCNNAPTASPRFGPPTALQIVTGNAQTADQNQLLPVPLTVQALDAAGRGLPGVKVDWTVTPGSGTLRAQAWPTVTDSTGLALVFWQLGSSLGPPQTVVAGCCELAVTFTAQALLPLRQRLRVISGSGQWDTVAHTLPQPVFAQVLRADGKPDVGAVVNWTTQNPGGSLSPMRTRADSAGLAATRWTLGTVAGGQGALAIVQGLPPAFAGAEAGPRPPVRVAITPNPLPLLAIIEDYVFAEAHAWDKYGNLLFDPVPMHAADSTIARAGTLTVDPRHHGSTWIIAQIGGIRDSLPLTVLGFTGVSYGGNHTCGLSLAGNAYCWGGANFSGSIGDGTLTNRPYPVLIGQGLGLLVPFGDTGHTCALAASGQAYCWGGDQSGELGDGSPTYATELRQTLPVVVAGGHLFTSVSAGNAHTCAVATNGDAYCWGDNHAGQLGRDTLTGTCILNTGHRCSNWPILVAGGLAFTQVSAGSTDHSCGVTTSGAAYCWGLRGSGQLGTASPPETCAPATLQPFPCSHTPQLVQGGLVFKSVKAGNNFTCGVTVTGDGYCWGLGFDGQLGNGAKGVSSASPVKVSGGLNFSDVQAGEWNACGLTTGGKLYCWGGAFGPVPSSGFPNLVFGALTVGGNGGGRACALTSDNDLHCWDSGR